MVEYIYVSRDYCFEHRHFSLAEMDIEHPGSYDICSFGDRTKRPVNNSSQLVSRDTQFCIKIDLVLLIPTILSKNGF